MNPMVLLLMLSDFLTETGFGLILPIIGIFINDSIPGGSIFSVGMADAIFLVTKSAIQLPLARYVDRKKNLSRLFLILGSFLVSFAPLIYLFATNVYWIYVAELVYGIGSGLSYPAWLSIWTAHLDKNKESFEWSLYSTIVSLGTAATAAVGATVAQLFGFRVTFLLVSAISAFGSILLLTMLDKAKVKSKKSFISKNSPVIFTSLR